MEHPNQGKQKDAPCGTDTNFSHQGAPLWPEMGKIDPKKGVNINISRSKSVALRMKIYGNLKILKTTADCRAV